MEYEELKALLELVQTTDWKVFEVHQGEFSLRLERPGEAPPLPAPAKMPPAPASVPPPPVEKTAFAEDAESARARELREEPDVSGACTVTSPLVGTFHILAEREITPGTRLPKGAPVCVVEAMKMMNDIPMPEDGYINWIAASEGEPVEYGQLLFTYVPDATGADIP